VGRQVAGRLAAREHRLDRLESAAMSVAAASFLVIISITVVDVVLRYMFRRPIMWAFDFIS
jgi:TRAP-type C4-dicarboxylate transport system permease small subunit